jgi:hypothetical protein
MGLSGRRRRREGMGIMSATMIGGETAQSRGLKLFGPGKKLCMAMLITTVTLAIVVVVAAMLLAANTSAVVLIGNIAQLMITNEYCHKSCTSKMSWMGNAGVAEMKWNETDINNI